MNNYNVMTAVVELIDADTEEQAIGILHARLREAGFEPYTDDPTIRATAFESEQQS